VVAAEAAKAEAAQHAIDAKALVAAEALAKKHEEELLAWDDAEKDAASASKRKGKSTGTKKGATKGGADKGF